MTGAPSPTRRHDHRPLYAALGVVVAILLVIGIVTYGPGQDDREARAKARELAQRFEEAGLVLPATEIQIVRAFGNDGGAVCENPADALGKALLNSALGNGASFVGQRPVIVPRTIVEGELHVLEVYCPEKAPAYLEKLEDLKFDDTVKSG